MARPRFSIAATMLVVLAIALGLAGLRDPSPLTAGAISTLTPIVLLAATLGACLRSGPARAPWLGFALFGWGYYLLACRPSPSASVPYPDAFRTTILREQVDTSEFVSVVLHRLYVTMYPFEFGAGTTEVWDWPNGKSQRLSTFTLFCMRAEYFQRIGHCLACFLLSLLGAVLGLLLLPPSRRGELAQPESSTSSDAE